MILNKKQIKNALHVLRQTSETNDISGDNSTKEASLASKVMLSASGILKQCLSEVLALKNKETVKNDEDIDFKDIDAEDLAVAYQQAQSSCAKEEDSG